MKVDLYTKTVLTVIAACLLVLTLQQVNVIPRAYAGAAAATAPTGLQTGASGPIDVRVVDISTSLDYSGIPVKVVIPSSGLPVDVKNSYISVGIKGSTLPVEVKNSYIYTKPY